jgi:hypothetical protein
LSQGNADKVSQLPREDYDKEEQTTSQDVSVSGTLDKEFVNDKAKDTGTQGQGTKMTDSRYGRGVILAIWSSLESLSS